MTRRLTIAIVGVVAATLVLAGLGTLLLSRLDDRESSERDLVGAAEAVVGVLETTTQGRQAVPRGATVDLRRALDLEGVGLILYAANGRVVASDLQDGLSLDDLDLDALSSGETVSGSIGDRIYAAAPGGTGIGRFAIVLTNQPDQATDPVMRWFIVAAVATLLLAVLVARLLGQRLVAPIRDARDATRRIAEGDFGARVLPEHTRDRDELAELARSIDHMAANLERSRGLERQFLLSVSHDLRTPMTSIQGYAEALQDGLATDPAAAGSIILSEARRLDRLVRDLLDLARLDSRRFSLELTAIDLADLAAEVGRGFEPELIDRQISLVVELPEARVEALADRDRTAQIIANLVENAARYARSTIRIAVETSPGWVGVHIADDGPGIDPDDLPHVFERLYVARQEPVERESGSGLGLAIVHELVGAMHGRVDAASQPPNGTIFSVWLPTATTAGPPGSGDPS